LSRGTRLTKDAIFPDITEVLRPGDRHDECILYEDANPVDEYLLTTASCPAEEEENGGKKTCIKHIRRGLGVPRVPVREPITAVSSIASAITVIHT
jgi:hypothetical protein